MPPPSHDTYPNTTSTQADPGMMVMRNGMTIFAGRYLLNSAAVGILGQGWPAKSSGAIRRLRPSALVFP